MRARRGAHPSAPGALPRRAHDRPRRDDAGDRARLREALQRAQRRDAHPDEPLHGGRRSSSARASSSSTAASWSTTARSRSSSPARARTSASCCASRAPWKPATSSRLGQLVRHDAGQSVLQVPKDAVNAVVGRGARAAAGERLTVESAPLEEVMSELFARAAARRARRRVGATDGERREANREPPQHGARLPDAPARRLRRRRRLPRRDVRVGPRDDDAARDARALVDRRARGPRRAATARRSSRRTSWRRSSSVSSPGRWVFYDMNFAVRNGTLAHAACSAPCTRSGRTRPRRSPRCRCASSCRFRSRSWRCGVVGSRRHDPRPGSLGAVARLGARLVAHHAARQPARSAARRSSSRAA